MDNRIIKFRVWDKRKTEFVKNPKRFQLNNWGLSYFAGISKYHQKNNYILQQFTGLKDIKGREIFEGDVLVRNKGEPYESKYEVVWMSARFELIHAKREGDDYGVFTAGLDEWSIKRDRIEIIGNRFENPELVLRS